MVVKYLEMQPNVINPYLTIYYLGLKLELRKIIEYDMVVKTYEDGDDCAGVL